MTLTLELYLIGFLVMFVTTAVLIGFHGEGYRPRWDRSDDTLAALLISAVWPIAVPFGIMVATIWVFASTHNALSLLAERWRPR